jgi:hypothetical protein
MTTFSLIALPADQVKDLGERSGATVSGGGSAGERDFALAIALVAIAAALVLVITGA